MRHRPALQMESDGGARFLPGLQDRVGAATRDPARQGLRFTGNFNQRSTGVLFGLCRCSTVDGPPVCELHFMDRASPGADPAEPDGGARRNGGLRVADETGRDARSEQTGDNDLGGTFRGVQGASQLLVRPSIPSSFAETVSDDSRWS
jgi:hypothetical protein